MRRFSWMMCAVLAAVLAAHAFEPQGKGKKVEQKQTEKDKKEKDKAAEPAKKDDAPKPLFEGTLGIKSSRQGKDSAALGFNGLDPEGKVTKEAMNAPPTKSDKLAAMSLVAYSPTQDELNAFMAQGSLKAGTPPAAPPEDNKKKR